MYQPMREAYRILESILTGWIDVRHQNLLQIRGSQLARLHSVPSGKSVERLKRYRNLELILLRVVYVKTDAL